MSDSDSDESVGARAARERLQPGTQDDYNNALQHIEDYVKETYTRDHEVYQRCMENDKLNKAKFNVSRASITFASAFTLLRSWAL